MTSSSDRLRRYAATAVALAIGAVVHVGALLNWSTDLDRTANPLGYASNFFDFQARSLMDGHLWVRPGSLGIEAFHVDGREYMYFGPFPALRAAVGMLTTSETPAAVASAVELILEGLHLTRRLNKDQVRGRATYRSRG